ncbi:NUDIX domain-containing protein [archaeon]|jgi:8-oxo-dGTP diphosphatase|nr:NUDIX domain-containing protein [archaeon]MBT4022166.1 NUDIX domain-containing protein [archaeon]MBT4272779.1 NUDIX domain-containing protein [archaeon]MBT4461578.1 NUDIX domain-containing protein [archaeon]MBT4857654.1 NUDIX domain-containing protein [archaeon]
MEKNRPKVGLGVFVFKDNKFLIQKRINSHGHNTWCLPGGHLEFFETFEECAKRETLEEAGVICDNINVLGVTNDFHTKENKHYITIFVKSNYISGEVKIMEPDKCLEWKWVTFDDLPENLFLPFKNFLKQKKNQKLFDYN